MAENVGTLGGYETGGPNGETYYLAVQAQDNGSFDVPYDEIEDGGQNRWHLHGYFDVHPDRDPDDDGTQDFSY